MVFILGRDPAPSLSSEFGEPWKGRKLPISELFYLFIYFLEKFIFFYNDQNSIKHMISVKHDNEFLHVV